MALTNQKKNIQKGRFVAKASITKQTRAAGSKGRSLTQSECRDKQAVIRQDMAKIDKAEDDKEQYDILGEIIAELCKNPEKLKRCRQSASRFLTTSDVYGTFTIIPFLPSSPKQRFIIHTLLF